MDEMASALAASSEPAVMLVIVAIIGGIALAVALTQASRRKAVLRTAARRFDGKVTTAWLSDSELELSVDGCDAHLTYTPGSRNRSPLTRIRFQAPLPHRLRVVPEGLWETLKKAFGSEDLQVGDPGFDAEFAIQGAPSAWVRKMLDEPTRRRILRLSELGAGFWTVNSVTLEAGPTGVMISAPRDLLREASTLGTFIGESIALFRRLREGDAPGIEFLPHPEGDRKGLCPVCEHPFAGPVRTCEACATPHHAECWRYFGGCTTYACERRGGS